MNERIILFHLLYLKINSTFHANLLHDDIVEMVFTRGLVDVKRGLPILSDYGKEYLQDHKEDVLSILVTD